MLSYLTAQRGGYSLYEEMETDPGTVKWKPMGHNDYTALQRADNSIYA